MVRINKKHALIVIVSIVLIVSSIAFFGGIINFSDKESTNTVKVGISKDCTSTPWIVGQAKGLFKKYNINLKDIGQIPAPQRHAAFLSGQINVYEDHPNSVINLIKSGANIKGVAIIGAEPINGTLEKEHMHWLVKEKGSINSVNDLKTFKEKNGRKIKIAVLNIGVCADLETNAFFRKNNISKDDYEFLVLPDEQQEQSLLQENIDIAVLHPPFFAKAEKDSNETNDTNKKLKILFTSTDAFGAAAGLTLLSFTNDYINKYPETVRDFIKAYTEGTRWINENRDESGNLTAEFIDLPYTSNVHWYSPSNAIDSTTKNYIQQWIDAMVEDGLLRKGEFTPDDLTTDIFKDTWRTDLSDN